MDKIQWLLATPIVLFAGWKFFTSAWRSFLMRAADMNTLIAIGTGVAYLYSTAGTFYSHIVSPNSHRADLYFEAAAVIIALVLLGRMLEAKAKLRTGDAIRGLIALQAKVANLLVDGKEKTVPIEEVMIGDILRVKPGESIPVDGKIVDHRIHGEG